MTTRSRSSRRTRVRRRRGGRRACKALILSLQEMPGRFPVIPEAEELGLPYRSALHHSHRVIFRVDAEKNTVYVVRVYHGARRPLTPEDVDPQDES